MTDRQTFWPQATMNQPKLSAVLLQLVQHDSVSLPCLSNGVLHPIQVSRFFVNAARPPTFDATIVLVRVCSPSANTSLQRYNHRHQLNAFNTQPRTVYSGSLP